MYHFNTCSAMDALQWMGAVRMRVQTADINITLIPKLSIFIKQTKQIKTNSKRPFLMFNMKFSARMYASLLPIAWFFLDVLSVLLVSDCNHTHIYRALTLLINATCDKMMLVCHRVTRTLSLTLGFMQSSVIITVTSIKHNTRCSTLTQLLSSSLVWNVTGQHQGAC